MLSFATEFPVEETSATEFCRSVAEWLDGSPHTQITAKEVLTVSEDAGVLWERADERLSCVVLEEEARRSAAFRYQKRDRGVHWTTTVCFDSDSVDSWVSVRTERQSEEAQAFVPDARKPFIVKVLINTLKGGVDGELRVSDAPHRLLDNDHNMVVRLMNGDTSHRLPIVYVSKPFLEDHFINVDALARHLAGVAHVLVEPDREFSRRLQPEVRSVNAYGGHVGLYFSENSLINIRPENYADDFDLRRDVFSRVRGALLNVRAMPRCSWAEIQGRVARRERKQLGSESAVDEYAAVFDREITAKEEQLAAAEQEISRLTSLLSLRTKATNSARDGVQLTFGDEQELSSDEFTEIVLDALEKAKSNELDGSRRAHVLTAAIASNRNPKTLEKKREQIKGILRGYRSLNGSIRSELSKVGFSISEDGKHIKLTYQGDDRYQCILPKSGGDNRGGINAATDIARRIF